MLRGTSSLRASTHSRGHGESPVVAWCVELFDPRFWVGRGEGRSKVL
jgi:hypothetical protein